eukprot:SAG31_NODE_8409_length_1457_cov_1.311487_3_plen_61_part_00
MSEREGAERERGREKREREKREREGESSLGLVERRGRCVRSPEVVGGGGGGGGCTLRKCE